MKRHEIRGVIKGLLEAALPEVPVFLDDGGGEVTGLMETALAEGGVCIAVEPILGSDAVSVTRGSVVERVQLAVHLRENPELMPVDHDATVSEVIRAILRANGGAIVEFEFGEAATRLVLEDVGLLTTGVHFTGEIITEV